MNICVAQTKPFTGDIEKNVARHIEIIDLAVYRNTDLIVFPELSLTGYEPTMAKYLAVAPDDARLAVFQDISDNKQISIGVGIPIKSKNGINISMILFQAGKPRQVYSKKYLHADEEEFFVAGENFPSINISNTPVALSICYEISIPKHSEDASKSGAKIYLASVAKFDSGIEKALARLSEISRQYAMTVLMCNSVGKADGQECAGKSSAWNNEGVLIGQLNTENEGLLFLDTEILELTKEML